MSSENCIDFLVIGGGAAGLFAALAAKRAQPKLTVAVLEKSAKFLSKVKVSGGGRCNVTHACFEPRELVRNYPRGQRELLGPFHRFGPRETVTWFAERGVELKTEADGRMFPVSDSSGTIIDCLLNEARRLGVRLLRRQRITSVSPGFIVERSDEEPLQARCLLVATGSMPFGHELARKFGHSIQEPVPSLFTFNVPQFALRELAGVAIQRARVSLVNSKQVQEGPLLITHWGFSGPAALRLSAWAARDLHALKYRCQLRINWLPDFDSDAALRASSAKHLGKVKELPLPRKLWLALLERAGLLADQRLAELSRAQAGALQRVLHEDLYDVEGKTTHKEEFVTCGGVSLSEIDFRSMQSRLCPGLYFAGEILDVDGITGGFNFQNAWCSGWTAGTDAASKLIQ